MCASTSPSCLFLPLQLLAGLLFGFDTGIISGALLFIQKDYSLSSGMSELVVSSILIGAVIGSLSSGAITDSLGRRKVMLVIAGLFILGTLVASFASSMAAIVVGRIILGLAIGIGSYTAPLYIAEAALLNGAAASFRLTSGHHCRHFFSIYRELSIRRLQPCLALYVFGRHNLQCSWVSA